MKKTIYKSNGIKAATPADVLDMEDIKKLKKYFLSLDLEKPNNLRNFTLFVFNLNIGLRAKDLLSLPKDLIIQNDKVVDIFAIRESKTGKKRIIELNNSAKAAIQKYYDSFFDKLKDSYYLFPSRKKNQGEGHLTLSAYDKILRNAKEKSEVSNVYTVSSHTARKCLGTALYNQGVPIQQIQMMFGHNKPETTMIYISALKQKSQKLYHQVEF